MLLDKVEDLEEEWNDAWCRSISEVGDHPWPPIQSMFDPQTGELDESFDSDDYSHDEMKRLPPPAQLAPTTERATQTEEKGSKQDDEHAGLLGNPAPSLAVAVPLSPPDSKEDFRLRGLDFGTSNRSGDAGHGRQSPAPD